MNTQPNTESLDSRHLAYGREVAELLSQSSAASWMNDLWEIYSGYMAAQTELGHSRRANDVLLRLKSCCFSFSGLRRGE